MRRLPFCSLTLSLMAIPIAHAAENTAPVVVNKDKQPTKEDTLVVTADRREGQLKRVLATTDVVTADDVHKLGYKPFVHDWLRGMPGVDVNVSGVFANTTSIRLRGADTAETRYLRDGIPISDASGIGGDPQVGFLDQSGITQVEVVRGAQSGLYGSAASGGVVNLIGIRPTAEHQLMAQADYGSFNTLSGTAQATGPIAKSLGFAASVGGIVSDGFSANTSPNADGDSGDHEKDAYQRLSANGRVEAKYDVASVFIAGSILEGETKYDSTFPSINPNDTLPTQVQETWQLSGGGTFKPTANSSIDARVAHTDSLRQYPNETTYTRDYSGTDDFTSLVATVMPLTGLSTMIGIDGLWQHVETVEATGTTSFDRGSRLIGAFVQLAYDYQWLSLNVTGRHDEHSSGDDSNTYRLGAACYLFDQQYKIVGNIGTGFLAPSLYQLYDVFSGNPDLEAQTSFTADIGHVITPTGTGLSLSNIFFQTRYDEKIDYSFTTFKYANISSDARIYGIENDLRWSFDQFSSGATYTWQDTDNGSGARLSRLPDHKLMIDGLVRQWDGWLRLYVERVWTVVDQGTVLAPYTLVGASAGYSLTQHWEIYGRLENITDEGYEQISQYSTPGRSVFGGVRATF